ncbi:MAG: hypothetical protein WC523_04940 [Patescibacteria group bacterium]
MADEEKSCVWNMGTPCGGSVQEIRTFNDQITISMCENHLKEHKILMALHGIGYDVEKLLAETQEWRENEYNTLVKSGKIDPNTIIP